MTDVSHPFEERAAALGRLSMNCTALEMSVLTILGGFFPSDPVLARLIVGDTNLSWRLDRIDALARDRLSDAARDRVVAWVSAVRAAIATRNRIVHDAWTVGDAATPGERVQISRKRVTRAPMTVDDVNVAVRDLGACLDTYGELVPMLNVDEPAWWGHDWW